LHRFSIDWCGCFAYLNWVLFKFYAFWDWFIKYLGCVISWSFELLRVLPNQLQVCVEYSNTHSIWSVGAAQES
jgi:hypothetical protein